MEKQQISRVRQENFGDSGPVPGKHSQYSGIIIRLDYPVLPGYSSYPCEAKALRKLRHPTRSEQLRSFLDLD